MMSYYQTPIRIQKLKRLSIPSVDKDVNKLELLYIDTAGGIIKPYDCSRQLFGNFLKLYLYIYQDTVDRQVPLSMEFSRQEYWSGLSFPSPKDLPNSGIEPGSPTLWENSLPSEPQVKSSKTLPIHLPYKSALLLPGTC